MAGKQVVDFVLIEKSLSRSKIGEVKDSTSLEEVSSVLKGKQQTEEQRGEDESESFKETLDENQGNLSSFNITITFERRQYPFFFLSQERIKLPGRLVYFLRQWKAILREKLPRLRRYSCVELKI